MALLTIDAGENFILRRKFFNDDGVTPVTFADIQGLTVQLFVDDVAVTNGTYTYNPTGPSYTAGMSHLGNSEFEIQVSKAISAGMSPGRLRAKWTLDIANDNFPVDSNVQTDIDIVEVGRVR